MRKVYIFTIFALLLFSSSCSSIVNTLDSTGRALDEVGNCMRSIIRLGNSFSDTTQPTDSINKKGEDLQKSSPFLCKN